MLKIIFVFSLLTFSGDIAAISKEEAVQVAEIYVRRVDNGFLSKMQQKCGVIREANFYTDLKPQGYPEMPFYSVTFKIIDYRQELVFKFSVIVLENTGRVVSPATDSGTPGLATSSGWLSTRDYCRFHPEASECYWEVPI